MAETSNELWQLDATELAALIRSGKVSSREATESVLGRIDAVNPLVNALTCTLHEEALAAADRADSQQARHDRTGPLHSVPLTTKINVDQQGVATDNGLAKFKDLIAQKDGTVVANLRRAGAIVVGRNNSPAFGLRGHTGNALHGLTLSPFNPDLTCGGSSGGAAVATATGMGPIAQGNDIAGSIRWPAHCNRVLGLRPTVGRVAHVNFTSTRGRPMAGQLMAVNGPFARSVRDIRLSLEVMSAPDRRDVLWTPAPQNLPPQPRRVALVTASEGPNVTSSTWDSVRKVGNYLSAAGYQVEEVSRPPNYTSRHSCFSASWERNSRTSFHLPFATAAILSLPSSCGPA